MSDGNSALSGPQNLEDVVMWGSDGEPFRYAGAILCARCDVWRPAFEDAMEVDEDGTIVCWSGIAAADCDDCRLTLFDTWEKSFGVEWATNARPARSGVLEEQK